MKHVASKTFNRTTILVNTWQTVSKCWRIYGEATAFCGFVSEWAASRLRRRSWTRTRRMQMWNCQRTWAERNCYSTATNRWKTYRPWWSGPSGDSARSSVTPRRGCACCSGMFCLEVHVRNRYYTGCLKNKFFLCIVCLVTVPYTLPKRVLRIVQASVSVSNCSFLYFA